MEILKLQQRGINTAEIQKCTQPVAEQREAEPREAEPSVAEPRVAEQCNGFAPSSASFIIHRRETTAESHRPFF